MATCGGPVAGLLSGPRQGWQQARSVPKQWIRGGRPDRRAVDAEPLRASMPAGLRGAD
jgi:hypothetical protein